MLWAEMSIDNLAVSDLGDMNSSRLIASFALHG
jgi:hypothetical protein